MSTNKLIPALRFPEFKNSEEWYRIKLKEFAKFFRGLTYGADDTSSNGLLVLRSGNIQNDTLVLNKDLVFVGKECPEDLKLLNGDVVICMSNGSKALVGKNAEYRGEYAGGITVGAFCSIMRPKNKFTKYFLQSDAYQSFIALSIGGGNINNLKNSDLEEFKCAAPKNPKEQNKIASCLSSLDEVIAAHSKKLDLLKDHKKGLMQNLFPQMSESGFARLKDDRMNGEDKILKSKNPVNPDSDNVPTLRFKEFVKDGEWVEKPLDDICKLVRGPFGGALKKEIFVKEGYAVYEQSHAIYSDFSSFRYYIDEDKFNELKRFSVKSGDLIMSCSGTMGKFALVPDNNKAGVINQALLKLTVKKGFDKLFIKMTLEADNNQEKLLSQSVGGAIKNVVSVFQIKELPLMTPSLQEQQKIASCLSSLDALITAQAEKIEQLKLHKKGLMQGLFPKIND